MLILVAGPPLSGVTGVARALAERMPGQQVREPAQLGPADRPAAVVFVLSAAAPMVGSDAALLDSVAARTDTLLAAVTKIDVHRCWREVLDANRSTLARRAPRYSAVDWFGIAAAPGVGPPRLHELVEALREALARDDLLHRNRLRARESELRTQIARRGRDTALRAEQRRRTERSATLAAARLRLLSQAERVCSELRNELRSGAAKAGRRDRLGEDVRLRVQEVVADFGRRADRELRQAVTAQAPQAWATPVLLPMPEPCTGLENRLSVLLGSGFGIGASLALGRLLGELLPGHTTAVGVLSSAAGIGLAGWLVRARRLLAQRATLDRWVTELSAGVRRALEEQVATRVLKAGAVPDVPSPGRELGAGHPERELEAVVAALDGNRRDAEPAADTGDYRADRATR